MKCAIFVNTWLCYLTIALFVGLFIIFINYDFVFINIVTCCDYSRSTSAIAAIS